MHISFLPQCQHNFVPEEVLFTFIPFGKSLLCQEASWVRRGARAERLAAAALCPGCCRLLPVSDSCRLPFHLDHCYYGRRLGTYLIGHVHHQVVLTLVSIAVLEGKEGEDGCFISCPRPRCCIQRTLITREKTNTDQYINISGCSLLPSTGCLPSNIWQRDPPHRIFSMNVS